MVRSRFALALAVSTALLAACHLPTAEAPLARPLQQIDAAPAAPAAPAFRSRTRGIRPRVGLQTLDLPYSGDLIDVSRCAFECGDLVYAWTMPRYVSKDQARSFGLVYNSRRAFPTAVIHADVATLEPSDYVSMYVLIGSTSMPYIDGSGTQAWFEHGTSQTNYNRLAYQIDARSLAAGVHAFEAHARFWLEGEWYFPEPTAQTGRFIVLPQDARLGRGWAFAGLQTLQLVSGLGGILITEGDGSAVYFAQGGTGYTAPVGEYSRLTVEGNSTYTRRYRDGTRVQFDYSTRRMISITDIHGETTTFEYSAVGDTLKAVRDPAGYPIKLNYDTNGRLSSMQDSTGGAARSYSFAYNASGELITITDNQDATTEQFTYKTGTTWGRLMETVTDQRGKVTTFDYDHTRRRGTTKFPKVAIAGDTAQQPTSVFYSRDTYAVPGFMWGYGTSESTARVYRNPANANPYIKSPRGFHSFVSTNAVNFPTALYTDSVNRYALFNRDAVYRVSYTRNFRGTEFYMEYDSASNLTKLINYTTGRRDSITYKDSTIGGIKVTIGPLDVRSNAPGTPQPTFRYDGVKVSKSWDLGLTDTIRFFMRSDGRPDSITDPGGHTTRYRYLGTLQNISEVNAPVSETVLSYDVYGRPYLVTTSTGDTRGTKFDTRNRITHAWNAALDTTFYTYDALYLTQVTDPKGQTYSFGYNGIGWDTVHVDPNGRADSLLYDLNGNLGRWKNRRGQITTFTYDFQDRLTQRNANGDVTTYTLRLDDSVVVAVNSAATDTLRFDRAGHLTTSATVIGGRLNRITRTYNLGDRVTQAALDTVGITASTATWRYNKAGQVDTVSSTYTGLIRMNRSSELLPLSISYPNGATLSLVPGSQYGPTHATASRLFGLPALDAAYGLYIQLDSLGRAVRSVEAPQDSFRTFVYDARRFLFTADRWYSATSGTCSSTQIGYQCPVTQTSSVWSKAYQYDQVGNPANTGDVVTTGNRLVNLGTDLGVMDSLVYDNDGNATTIYRGGTSDHQLLSWNAIGQLTSLANYTGGILQNTVTFTYDGFGRRVSKAITGTTTRYIWDQDLLFGEYAGNNLSTFLYKPESYVPISTTRNTTPYYYTTDEAENILGVIDGSANVVNAYRYYPFGYAHAASELLGNPMRFNGQYFDPETNLHYMRNRYYDSRARRFISEDPIGLAGGINPYVYADNDPINSSDPLGLQNEDCESIFPPDYLGVGISCPRWPFRTPRGSGATSRFGNRGTGTPSTAGMFGGGGVLSSAGAAASAVRDRLSNEQCRNALLGVGGEAALDVGTAIGLRQAAHFVSLARRAGQAPSFYHGEAAARRLAAVRFGPVGAGWETGYFALTSAEHLGWLDAAKLLGGFVPFVGTGIALWDAGAACVWNFRQ